MLRAATFPLFGMDAKFWGLVTMGAAVIIPAHFLARPSPVKSMRYKGWPSDRVGALRQLYSSRMTGFAGDQDIYHARAVIHAPVLRVFRSNALVHSR